MEIDNKKTSRVSDILSIIFPGLLSAYILLGFPIFLILERDVQLNGINCPATVIEEATRRAKFGEYRVINAEYIVNGKSYTKWVSNKDIKVGEKLEVRHSSWFPSYSYSLTTIPDPWDINIFFRLFIFSLFGLLSGIISFASYKKYLEKKSSNKA